VALPLLAPLAISDGTVSNNHAVRAPSAVRVADSSVAAHIPPAPFIELVPSATWTDRNKASLSGRR
jgi:hypothetical protein